MGGVSAAACCETKTGTSSLGTYAKKGFAYERWFVRCINGFHTTPDWFHLTIGTKLDILSEQLDGVLNKRIKFRNMTQKEGLRLRCHPFGIL